jgi:CHAT domain-containing protein
LIPDEEAASLVAHAANCNHCGPLLREATEDLAMAPTEQETAELARYTPEWQRQMAARMSAASRPAAAESRGWLGWLRIPAWGYAVATAVVVVALGVGWWVTRETPLQKTERLLAEAYTERREMPFRFGNAAYSVEHVERGGDSSRPPALSEAEFIASTGLKAHQEDAAWLDVDGRVKLLSRYYEDAIRQFKRALEVDPESIPARIDLAAAYFQLAGNLGEKGSIYYGMADEMLGQVLAKQPDNLVALFNRAIIAEKVPMPQSAVDYWEHYLRLDPKSDWSREARQHLQEIQKNLKGHKEAPNGLDRPDEFLASFDVEGVDQNVEDYLDIVSRNWLPRVFSQSPGSESARQAATRLAEVLKDRHGDLWLSDLLAEPQSPALVAGVQELVLAMNEGVKNHFEASTAAAVLAQSYFQTARCSSGILRSRLQQIYGLQRSLQSRRCVDAAKGLTDELRKKQYAWMEGRSLLEQSACWNQAGDKDLAGLAAERALQAAEHANYPRLALRALAFSGSFATRRGDFATSWALARRGLVKYWANIGSPRQVLGFYSDLVFVSDLQGQGYLAYALSREAAEIGSMTEPLAEATERFRMARLASSTGQGVIASLQFALADRLFSVLPVDKTMTAYRASAQTALARLEIGRGRSDLALQRLRLVKSAVTETDSYNIPLAYYSALGEAEYKIGSINSAAEALQNAVGIAEQGLVTLRDERNRIAWTRETANAYRTLVEVRLRTNKDPRDAWEIWEWYRAAPLRKPEVTLSQRALTPGFSFENVDSIKLDHQQRDLEHLVKELGNKTILTYAFLPGGLALWLVDRRGVSGLFPLGNAEKISHMAERFGQECARPDSDLASLNKMGRDLYNSLVGPIASHLSPNAPVLIEPDGAINSIPFQALVGPDGHYWGEDFDLTVSTGLLYGMRLRTAVNLSSSMQALVLGVDTGSQSPLAGVRPRLPLPDVAQEASRVSGRFNRAATLLGSAATIERVLEEMPKAAIIHLATHGQAGFGGSGIWLASAQGPSLIAAERLLAAGAPKGQLAVLSACETEGAVAEGPSGADSLVRAFLSAGVPRVVASRWSVDSSATAKFMDTLYTSLLSGHELASSLRQAERKIRDSAGTAHPYYWAAFDGFGRN